MSLYHCPQQNSNAICFQTIGSIQKLPIGSNMNISTSFGADRIGSYILDSIQFSFMIRKAVTLPDSSLIR